MLTSLPSYGTSQSTVTDPAATSNDDLAMEQTLRTEASDPLEIVDKYDLGRATYGTRWGAVGGNAPDGYVACEDGDVIAVASTVYYSFFEANASELGPKLQCGATETAAGFVP